MIFENSLIELEIIVWCFEFSLRKMAYLMSCKICWVLFNNNHESSLTFTSDTAFWESTSRSLWVEILQTVQNFFWWVKYISCWSDFFSHGSKFFRCVIFGKKFILVKLLVLFQQIRSRYWESYLLTKVRKSRDCGEEEVRDVS